MQKLRLFFAMALLYMFRVTIPGLVWSTTCDCMLAVVSNIIVITDFFNLQYTCLPERPYTALYSWWWVGLSPETCRVKPLRRINAIVASCWNCFTMSARISNSLSENAGHVERNIWRISHCWTRLLLLFGICSARTSAKINWKIIVVFYILLTVHPWITL